MIVGMVMVLYLLCFAVLSTYIIQCDCCIDFKIDEFIQCCLCYLYESVWLVYCGFICSNWTDVCYNMRACLYYIYIQIYIICVFYCIYIYGYVC
jgi:hypothetical protein